MESGNNGNQGPYQIREVTNQQFIQSRNRGSLTQRDRSTNNQNSGQLLSKSKDQHQNYDKALKSLSQMKNLIHTQSQNHYQIPTKSNYQQNDNNRLSLNRSNNQLEQHIHKTLVKNNNNQNMGNNRYNNHYYYQGDSCQKENMSSRSNMSQTQSKIYNENSQQEDLSNTSIQDQLDNNQVQISMNVFMNHPAFQKQRSKLVSLANISQKQNNIKTIRQQQITSNRKSLDIKILNQSIDKSGKKSNPVQKFLKTNNIISLKNLPQQQQYQDNNNLEHQTLNESRNNVQTTYDFSSLDQIDVQTYNHNVQTLQNNNSFENMLQDVTHIIPSMNSFTNHNTGDSGNSFNPQQQAILVQDSIMNTNPNNNLEVSFSEYNETEVKRKLVYPKPQKQQIVNNFISDHHNTGGVNRQLTTNQVNTETLYMLSESQRHITDNSYVIQNSLNFTGFDNSPRFPDPQVFMEQHKAIKQIQDQSRIRDIIKKVERENQIKQQIIHHNHQSQIHSQRQSNSNCNSIVKSRNYNAMNLNQATTDQLTTDKSQRIGKEVKREELSQSIFPKMDLSRRNSLENLYQSAESKFRMRSKSLSNLRTNLGIFSDTTEKKIQNNKLTENKTTVSCLPLQIEEKNLNLNVMKFQFILFQVFMCLMMHNKNPIAFMIELYLKQKQSRQVVMHQQKRS